MRPVIGITSPVRRFNRSYWTLWLAVLVNGGHPRILTSKTNRDIRLDGLLLGGGTDVFPGLYQRDPKQNYLYDPERDDMEISWLHWAEEDNIPVLGICRGAQMMNVVHGGSLHMDVALAYEDAIYPNNFWSNLFFRKQIMLKLDSDLYKMMQCETAWVNSIHKQSIDRLAENLDICAEEPNGVIQAIERADHPFYIGVQFHPEFLIYRKRFRRLFQAFIEQARHHATSL